MVRREVRELLQCLVVPPGRPVLELVDPEAEVAHVRPSYRSVTESPPAMLSPVSRGAQPRDRRSTRRCGPRRRSAVRRPFVVLEVDRTHHVDGCRPHIVVLNAAGIPVSGRSVSSAHVRHRRDGMRAGAGLRTPPRGRVPPGRACCVLWRKPRRVFSRDAPPPRRCRRIRVPRRTAATPQQGVATDHRTCLSVRTFSRALPRTI